MARGRVKSLRLKSGAKYERAIDAAASYRFRNSINKGTTTLGRSHWGL